MNRTDRLLGLLLALQGRGWVRAEDLAQRFEVSVRTVYRDMGALAESGVPLLGSPGQGYRLMEGYFLPPLSFTPTEAALLLLGGEYVRSRVDPELRRAAEDGLAKLAAILPAERRADVERWHEALAFPQPVQTVESPHLGALRAAVRARQVVRLLYHTYGREAAAWRDVEPTRLICASDAWYLVAWCRLRQAMRVFRLERIDALQPLAERFVLAARHAVERDDESWRTALPAARVRVDAAILRWVRERQPHVFLREEHDEAGVVCVYALLDEGALARWLLGWGGAVEVLEPAALRRRVAAAARAIAARHERDTTGDSGNICSDTDMMVSGALP